MTQTQTDEPLDFVDVFGLDELVDGLAKCADRLAVRSNSPLKIVGSGALPHAGTQHACELPAAVARGRQGKHILRLLAKGSPAVTPLERVPAMRLPDLARRSQERNTWSLGSGSDDLDQTIAVLESFRYFGTALSTITKRSRCEPSVIRCKHVNWMPSSLFLETLAEELYERNGPPVMAITIVRERLHHVLAFLERNLRRQLRRERKMLPVGLVQDVDPRCIDWLARQPGKSLRERAGPRQQILAVVRESTVDTYENRILKLCLELIDQCVREYECAFGKLYRSHVQVKDLRAFGQLCRSMLSIPEIGALPPPSDTSRPNYVLQYGKHYSDVWWAYELLRNQKAQTDDLWRWRHRICGEMLALDFALAATRVDGVRPLEFDREVGVRDDPIAGHWIHFGSGFPSRIVHRSGSRYEIEVRLPLHKLSGDHGPRSSDVDVVVRSLDLSASCRLPVVAIASGMETAPLVSQGCLPTLIVQQGDASVTQCAGLEHLPSASVGTFWPLRPSDRTEAAKQVLEVLIQHLESADLR